MSTSYLTQTSNEPTKMFNVELPYPKKYTLRCIDCVFKRSKTSDNPMLERTWEIIAPSTVNVMVNGEKKEVSIAGLTFKDWLTMSAKTAEIVRQDSAWLSVTPPDDEMPNTEIYKGKEATGFVATEKIVAKDPDTQQPITDSAGKPSVSCRYTLAKRLM